MIILYILAGTIAVVGLWTFLGGLCARDMDGLMVADWTNRKEPQSW